MTFAVVVAAAALAVATIALLRRLGVLVRPGRPAPPDGARWESRPILGGLVVASAHLIPVVAAVGTSVLLSRRLPRPSGWVATAITWAFLFSVSTVVLVVIERLARRLLPLGALLKLSLAFPDRAPRRLSVARRAGTVRDLEARLARARSLGIDDEPARAAETILTLVGALHAHDRRTRGHAERVRTFTDLLADELHISPDDRDRLRWAALLHDIGKVHVPAKILNKPGAPTPREWHILRRHPIDGARLAAPLFDWLGAWSLTIEQHHERWGGHGYPYGLRGEQISYGARIVSVADSFDAMTAARSYQRARSAVAARRELTRQAGRDFDPAVVRAFLNISITRLRWVLGPLSWLGQAPLVRWVPQAAEGVASAGSEAAGVIGTAAGAAVIATGTAVAAGHMPATAVQGVAGPIAVAASSRATPAAAATTGGWAPVTDPGSGATSPSPSGVTSPFPGAPDAPPDPGAVLPDAAGSPTTTAPASSGTSGTGTGGGGTAAPVPAPSPTGLPSSGGGGTTATTTTTPTALTVPPTLTTSTTVTVPNTVVNPTTVTVTPTLVTTTTVTVLTTLLSPTPLPVATTLPITTTVTTIALDPITSITSSTTIPHVI